MHIGIHHVHARIIHDCVYNVAEQILGKWEGREREHFGKTQCTARTHARREKSLTALINNCMPYLFTLTAPPLLCVHTPVRTGCGETKWGFLLSQEIKVQHFTVQHCIASHCSEAQHISPACHSMGWRGGGGEISQLSSQANLDAVVEVNDSLTDHRQCWRLFTHALRRYNCLWGLQTAPQIVDCPLATSALRPCRPRSESKSLFHILCSGRSRKVSSNSSWLKFHRHSFSSAAHCKHPPRGFAIANLLEAMRSLLSLPTTDARLSSPGGEGDAHDHGAAGLSWIWRK